MSDSTSRWEPPKSKTKFSWIGDPADRFRGRGGKARITGADSGRMLDYNKSLYAPIDRGGGQAFRVNGQPERFTGIPTPSAPTEAPLPTTNAGILARYDTPQPGRATVRPANAPPIGTPPPVVDIAPTATRPQALVTPGAVGPTGTTGTSPVTNPATVDTPTNVSPPVTTGTPPTMLHGVDPSFGQPLTGEEIGGAAGVHPVTGEPIRTPEQKAAEDKRLFIAQGGSEASYHRAQVAAGIRPVIDARTRQSPLNSTASMDIQQGWAAKRKQLDDARAGLHSVMGN